MGMIEDVMRALERIPLWKRVSALPERTDELERRIAAIEAKLSGKTGELCPLCGEAGFRRTASRPHPVMGDLGIIEDTFQCPSCQHSESRTREG